MKKMLLIFCVVSLISISCTGDLYREISTNNKVPDKKTIPAVKSFELRKSLILEWEKDIGAEEYILYRSIFPNSGYDKIATLTDTKYIDTDVAENSFYYYKLAKKRGQKEFDKSDFSFGVGSLLVKDSYEDNNTEDRSVNINSINMVNANIYFARDVDGLGKKYELDDIDCYNVVVEPKRQYRYRIIFENNSNGLSYTGILTVYHNNKSEDLSKDSEFLIYNETDDNKKITFRIEINKNNILSTPDTKGVRVEPYTLYWLGVETYTPM